MSTVEGLKIFTEMSCGGAAGAIKAIITPHYY